MSFYFTGSYHFQDAHLSDICSIHLGYVSILSSPFPLTCHKYIHSQVIKFSTNMSSIMSVKVFSYLVTTHIHQDNHLFQLSYTWIHQCTSLGVSVDTPKFCLLQRTLEHRKRITTCLDHIILMCLPQCIHSNSMKT